MAFLPSISLMPLPSLPPPIALRVAARRRGVGKERTSVARYAGVSVFSFQFQAIIIFRRGAVESYDHCLSTVVVKHIEFSFGEGSLSYQGEKEVTARIITVVMMLVEERLRAPSLSLLSCESSAHM